jgi:hypothetical protein
MTYFNPCLTMLPDELCKAYLFCIIPLLSMTLSMIDSFSLYKSYLLIFPSHLTNTLFSSIQKDSQIYTCSNFSCLMEVVNFLDTKILTDKFSTCLLSLSFLSSRALPKIVLCFIFLFSLLRLPM